MISWEGQVVTIPQALLEETYMRLRACGQRHRECQVFWVSSWANSNRIGRIVHPVHTATSVSVDVDMASLNEFFLELADRNECVRAQVHSHPGSAFHSGTDDRWPVVRFSGFLSLVIPDFATGPTDLAGTYLAEQDENGGWRSAVPQQRIRLETAAVA